ncbi:MAG: adenylate/guanylate cyclase domain-containing protein, partial [Rhodospirillaceae bacterium]|nr:adenylate/guanylate cyclase domain-containing protein [Rhodospirillaceae bacterium]
MGRNRLSFRFLRRAWRAVVAPYGGIDGSPILQAQFEQVEATGVRLAHWFRAVSMLVACSWILARAPILSALYYVGIAAVLVASGYVQSVLARRGVRRHALARYGFILFDAALITTAVLLPNPTVPYDWPIAMQLRLGNYEFLLIFLLLAGLTFSPATVLATGASLGVCWSIGMTLILMRADVFTVSLDALYTINNVDSVLELMLNRHYVSAVVWAQQIVILTILTGILAATAVRSRRLASREVRLAYERANLARYFSPNLARTLATAGEALAHPKQHSAAVLFVDLVGFTRLCEQLAPDDSVTLLQSYYQRCAGTVFAHQGTLNKYIGDAVMATFGIFEQEPRPATRALACAHDL